MTLLVTIKVSPKAKQSKIIGWHRDALKVAVNAAPENGEANRALLSILANVLGLPSRSFTLKHGHSSKTKVIAIEITAAEFKQIINQHLGILNL